MAERYDSVAITLHWVIALAIIAMIPLGFFMGDLPASIKFDAYILHKSLGISILALSLLRVVWRFLNPPPALPSEMPVWEKLGARLSHWGLYFLILAMPITGWLMVSASRKYPTVFFWSGEVPFIPLPEDMLNKDTAHLFNETHELLAFGAIALVTLHLAAALKHHFVNHDSVLSRMLPACLLRKSDA